MSKARDLANLGSDTAALATDAEVSSAVAPKANTTDVNTALAAKADTTALTAAVPSQTGQSGKYLTTNGTATSWATVDALPSQTGQSGNYLTTNGTVASWAALTGVPSGTVMFIAQNTAPTGYMKANGAAVSRSTYSALFSAIGTTFGVGDGSTTFNIPDLRGYFPRGWADNGSLDSGRTFGSAQTATSIFAGDQYAAVAAGISNPDANLGSSSGVWYSNAGQSTFTRYAFRPYNVALLAVIKF